MIIYRIAWFVAQIYAAILFPTRVVTGKKYMNAKGPLILCCNHRTGRDPIIVVSRVWRPVHFMAKRELFAKNPMKFFMEQLGAFPISRGRTDMRAIRQSLKVLKEGGVFGIFPEGTRHPEAKGVEPLHDGVGMIALKSGAPVVPIYLQDGPMFHMNRLYAGAPLHFSLKEGELLSKETIHAATLKVERAMMDLYDLSCQQQEKRRKTK
nr:lysophospholipid acyltransferase family protein [Maliibacterium massiliense]